MIDNNSMEELYSISSSSCEEIVKKLQGLHLVSPLIGIVYTKEALLQFMKMDIPARIHYGKIYVLEDVYLVMDDNSETIENVLQNCNHQETRDFIQFLMSSNITRESLFIGERERITYTNISCD